ncbi:hypothetical protein [Chryseobacterium sp. YIM B08800]|uniref:hypothetical protein n=1 Tax=Chryseobacterium sp. YIM B08800 TaxID=2984136 RepID=UPI002240B8FE|nr:hypothetical protein [Chryseobacterium sp. YIM B08800]
METITIEIPEGYEIENFDKTTGRVSFKEKPKDIKKMIKNFSDVLKYHGIDDNDFHHANEGLEGDEIAYRKIKLIVSAYNLKEVPDYNNSNQRKYEPRFYIPSSSGAGFSYDDYDDWVTYSGVGSRLCFLDYDNMIDATIKFLDVYEEFITTKSN